MTEVRSKPQRRGSESETLSSSPDPKIGKLGHLGPIKGPFYVSMSPLCKIRITALIWPSHHVRGPTCGPGWAGLAPAHRGSLTRASCPHVWDTPHMGSPWVYTGLGIHACVPLHVSPCPCPCAYAWTYVCTNAVPISVSKCVLLCVFLGSWPTQLRSVKPCLSANPYLPLFEKTQHFLQFSNKKTNNPV